MAIKPNNDQAKVVAKVIAGLAAQQGLKRYFAGSSSSSRSGYRPNKRRFIESSHTSTNAGNSVRFNDMGERGNATSIKYKRRKKLPYKKRRRMKRFKRKVMKVIKPRQAMNTIQGTWSSPSSWDAATLDFVGSSLTGGVQIVIGADWKWGINHGDATAAGGFVGVLGVTAQEMQKYQPRISGTDIAIDNNQARDNNVFYVQRGYAKLTIQNPNSAKDLIFDLYECVAATDISSDTFATPALAWSSMQETVDDYATGTQGEIWLKGTEPTDCPNFGKYWKILKKTVVRIPAASDPLNAYQTFKMYSPRFIYRGQRFNQKYAVKGITKYFMIIIDPEQGPNRYVAGNTVARIYKHVNYHYKPLVGQGGLNNINAAPNWIRTTVTGPVA